MYKYPQEIEPEGHDMRKSLAKTIRLKKEFTFYRCKKPQVFYTYKK
jgi:hypothetical protein